MIFLSMVYKSECELAFVHLSVILIFAIDIVLERQNLYEKYAQYCSCLKDNKDCGNICQHVL